MAVQSVAGVPKAAAATKLKVAKIGEVGYAVLTGLAMHISVLAEEAVAQAETDTYSVRSDLLFGVLPRRDNLLWRRD